MGSMVHGGDLFGLGEGIASEPGFETAFHGYKREQVDKYVHQIEAEIAALAAERENAYDQVQALSAQVHQLSLEMAELRRRSNTRIDEASFEHLGGRVGQILSLAEEEAKSIR